jgi:hypothetical protein
MTTDPEQGNGRHESWWDVAIERIADVPWGLLLVVFAFVVLITGWTGVEESRAILTAAGLFGIGHGIHTAAKVQTRSRALSSSSAAPAVATNTAPKLEAKVDPTNDDRG